MTPPEVEALLVHEPFVRGVARALLRGDPRVEDVVQDTWVAALQGTPRDPAATRGWLAGIVRNIVRTRLRRDAVRARNRPAAPPAVPGARVEVALHGGGLGSRSMAFSDATGRFEVRGLRTGRFIVAARTRDLVFEHLDGVEAGARDAVVRAGTKVHVAGRIVWPEGIEPRSVRVLAFPADRPLPRRTVRGWSPPQPAARRTKDGAFAFDRLVGARFTLWVEDGEYAFEPIEVAAGTTDVELKMLRGVALRGRVVGMPDEQEFYVQAEAADGRGEVRSAPVKPDGSFELTGLAPTRVYYVRAYDRAGTLIGIVEEARPGSEGLAIALQKVEKTR
ncbi:MAG: RNA polymerase sigma factor [Planctomycetota bacterium]